MRVGAKQLVHTFLGGKGLGIQQRTSVWIGSPKSINELVEFEKNPVEIQDCKRIANHVRRFFITYLKYIKVNRDITTCNRLDLK